MKVNIQQLKSFTKRFIPVLTAVLVLVCCISFPASAEALNYRDYEVSVTVDGNNDIVTLGFPYEQWADWVLRPFDGGSEIATGQGYEFQGEFPWMDDYEKFYLMIAPFGGASFSSRVSPYEGYFLSTDNIPSDAKWSATVVVTAADEGNTLSPVHFTSRSWAVDGSSAFICDYISPTSFVHGNYRYEVLFSGDVLTDYGGWFPQFLFHFSADSSILYCCLSAFEVTMSINSYYRVLEDMGYDEQIDELRQELEKQNIKLDSVINGTPEQNEQAGALGDSMQGAIDDLHQTADDIGSATMPSINFQDYMPHELKGDKFIHFSTVLGSVWQNETLARYTSLLGAFILISFILFGEKH